MQESYELLDLDRLNRMYWYKRMVQLKAELQQPAATAPLQPPVSSEPRYGQRPTRSRPTAAPRTGTMGAE
ncbi:MAG TPA: hypothetical protein V6C65_35105 [Allocoleopsis sp.]